MLLLDTSALSAVMHRVPNALERLRPLEPWSIVLCAPVAAEIHYGLCNLVQSSKRRRLLEKEYRLIREVARWADWNEEAAYRFGSLKAELREKGTQIDDLDVAIASIALTLGATVATRNVRHFERVEGLQVEPWEPWGSV
ncbi:MAG: type II toxin-antitoxin system VapC family toxin [Acidobacteria bacterium]|nr:MAG: type II toxin-antitoxin system VapC family toxin [Acidobacteriota bacterium]